MVKCPEGDEVIPGTVLHLQGDQSYSSKGDIDTWEWNVDQPAGSSSSFVPSATVPRPSFKIAPQYELPEFFYR